MFGRSDRTETAVYRIRVAGRLDQGWARWFDGFTLAADDDGCTSLTGAVADQAALHGVLMRIRDLGVPLVAVAQLDSDGTDVGRAGTSAS
jgi:hypothetical protein